MEDLEKILHVDSRFASFHERLNSLRRPGESDRAFACRMGAKLSTFRKWKHGVHAPELMSTYERLSSALSVGLYWLTYGYDCPRLGPLTRTRPTRALTKSNLGSRGKL